MNRGAAVTLIAAAAALGAPSANAQQVARGQGVAFVDDAPLTFVAGDAVTIDVFNGGRELVRVRLRPTGALAAKSMAFEPAKHEIRVGRTESFRVIKLDVLSEPVKGGIVALSSDGSLARRVVHAIPADWPTTSGPPVELVGARKGLPLGRSAVVLTSKAPVVNGVGVNAALRRDRSIIASIKSDHRGHLVVAGTLNSDSYRDTIAQPGQDGLVVTVLVHDQWGWIAGALGVGVVLAWLLLRSNVRRTRRSFAAIDEQARSVQRQAEPIKLPAIWDYREPRDARAAIVGRSLGLGAGRDDLDAGALHAALDRYVALGNRVTAVVQSGRALGRNAAREVTAEGWCSALQRAVASAPDLRSACERVAAVEALVTTLAELDAWLAGVQSGRNDPAEEIKPRGRLLKVGSPETLTSALTAAGEQAPNSPGLPSMDQWLDTRWEWKARALRLGPIARFAGHPDMIALAVAVAITIGGAQALAEADASFGSLLDYLTSLVIGFAATYAAIRVLWRWRTGRAEQTLRLERELEAKAALQPSSQTLVPR